MRFHSFESLNSFSFFFFFRDILNILGLINWLDITLYLNWERVKMTFTASTANHYKNPLPPLPGAQYEITIHKEFRRTEVGVTLVIII